MSPLRTIMKFLSKANLRHLRHLQHMVYRKKALILILFPLLFALSRLVRKRRRLPPQTLHTPVLLELPNDVKQQYYDQIASSSPDDGTAFALVVSKYEPSYQTKVNASVWRAVCPGGVWPDNRRDPNWVVSSEGSSLAVVAGEPSTQERMEC